MAIVRDGQISLKVLYYGSHASGKTTAVDTLYHLFKSGYSDKFVPTSALKKIAMKDGSTLYFDRGIFKAKNGSENTQLIHVFTVAGQKRFLPIRKKLYQNTDGVIFVFDAQRDLLAHNIESLKELKNLAGAENLISKIPLLIMLNKQDLPNVFRKQDIEEMLQKENLFYPPDHKLASWNPIIYETIALPDKQQDIYPIFAEMVRRINVYRYLGDPSTSQPKFHPGVPQL